MTFYQKTAIKGMVKERDMDIQLGDRVRWECAAGTLRGEVVKMELAPNAAGQRIPWIVIERTVNNKPNRTRLAAYADNLAMMRLKVIFRG